MHEPSLSDSVATLTAFLGRRPLPEAIAGIEADVEHATALEIRTTAVAAGIDARLLTAAIKVRRDLGRLDDMIRAAAILGLLPAMLEDGETLVSRPSLGAASDPRRPFDVESNLRVAEFHLAAWTGRDDMRKRELFKDFVRLAADTSGRRPELLVVGPEPRRFLETSRSRASWALDRSPGMQRLFLERFGDLSATVASFTAGPGARVHIVDVAPMLPAGILAAEDEAD